MENGRESIILPAFHTFILRALHHLYFQDLGCSSTMVSAFAFTLYAPCKFLFIYFLAKCLVRGISRSIFACYVSDKSSERALGEERRHSCS